jgi:ParB-like chromosome segregation protein Spo0J
MSDLLPDWRANLFPAMDETALAELTADIRDHGQREPIVVFNGKVLGGWHRYQACCKLGIEPKTKDLSSDLTEGQALAYALAANLTRRHLTDVQRAVIVDKISTMRQGERTDLADLPPNGGRSANPSNGGISQSKAAALMKVPVRQVQRAAKVRKEAPQLVEKVESGEMSLSKAAAEADRIMAHHKREAITPVRPAPIKQISAELIMILKGKKATLTSWMRQHQDDGIPAFLATLAAAIEAAERLIS